MLRWPFLTATYIFASAGPGVDGEDENNVIRPSASVG